jgi:S1-C subfamily serine protease
MKNLFSNVVVAIVSTAFSFFLFKTYFPPQMVYVGDNDTSAQLVNNVNKSPRDWSTTALPGDFVETSRKVTPAVVNITSFSAAGSRMASGSGVIISADGYIITNNHVIDGGSGYQIKLHNNRTLEARLIGIDPTTDLALLKASARNLRTLTYGNSDLLKVGEWVLAVGNPFNLTSTVTAGIVSAKARNINILEGAYSIESFIQTDAVVNPGNSGGALVNSRGELIGINTAIISSQSGGYEGYSFAVPSNLVKKVITDLKEFGEVQRAILGVEIAEVNDEIAADYNLPSVEGVFIQGVSSNSSASGAGLRRGDVIVSINGVQTNSVPELQEQVALFRPGDSITLEYFRDGRKVKKSNVILKGLGDTSSSFRR